MITLRQITDIKPLEWDFIYTVFEESFPVNEIRHRSDQELLAVNEKQFFQFIIQNETTPIGVLSYWDFGGFIFGEHLAIKSEFRSGGVGSMILMQAVQSTSKPWVLEVERGNSSEMAARRIALYERLGFTLFTGLDYVQPSYQGFENVPMYLMSTSDLDLNVRGREVAEVIYKEVYNRRFI